MAFSLSAWSGLCFTSLVIFLTMRGPSLELRAFGGSFSSAVDLAAGISFLGLLETPPFGIRASSSSISGGSVGESIGGKSHKAGFSIAEDFPSAG